MTAANYSTCLKAVLLNEGGYSNDPADPGGATMKGITQRVYDAFRKAGGLPYQPVRFIADVEVASIFRKQYWAAIQGDLLPAGLDNAVFDEAVNSGPVKAIKDLQVLLNLRADGQIGVLTEAAIRGVDDRAGLINRYCDRRLSFLHHLSIWKYFGKGWSNRIASVRKLSLQLSAQ